MTNKITFSDLKISEQYVSKLSQLNITNPTKVQEVIIPEIFNKKNILFQSETGTGKTFAYLLPLLEKIDFNCKNVQIIIITPTQELGSQIKGQIQLISNINVALFFGGSPIKRQLEKLKEKPQIVIGGAERISELLYLKKLKAENTYSLVLDEVDRLLSPEMKIKTLEIIGQIAKAYYTSKQEHIQLISCSATIKNSQINLLEKTIKEHDKDFSSIEIIKMPEENVLKEKITHWAFYAEQRNKIENLIKILNSLNPEKALIFCSNTSQIPIIANKLAYKKFNIASLHAKTEKQIRKQTIDRFKSGKYKYLVTSDLAARGLDIQNISCVIQMDLPSNQDFFIHRAGRTGRAGKEGLNILIGDGWEMKEYAKLEKKLGIIVYPKVLYKGEIMAPEENEQ